MHAFQLPQFTKGGSKISTCTGRQTHMVCESTSVYTSSSQGLGLAFNEESAKMGNLTPFIERRKYQRRQNELTPSRGTYRLPGWCQCAAGLTLVDRVAYLFEHTAIFLSLFGTRFTVEAAHCGESVALEYP